MAIKICDVEQHNLGDPSLAVMYDTTNDSRTTLTVRTIETYKHFGVILPEGVPAFLLCAGYLTEDEQWVIRNYVFASDRLEVFMDWMVLEIGSLDYEALWPAFVEYEREHFIDLYAVPATSNWKKVCVRIDKVQEHLESFDRMKPWWMNLDPEDLPLE